MFIIFCQKIVIPEKCLLTCRCVYFFSRHYCNYKIDLNFKKKMFISIFISISVLFLVLNLVLFMAAQSHLDGCKIQSKVSVLNELE